MNLGLFRRVSLCTYYTMVKPVRCSASGGFLLGGITGLNGIRASVQWRVAWG